jgi:hypothetical protein
MASVAFIVSDTPEREADVADALLLGVATFPRSSTVRPKLIVPGAPPVPLQILFATVEVALAVHESPDAAKEGLLVKAYESAASTEGSPPVAT